MSANLTPVFPGSPRSFTKMHAASAMTNTGGNTPTGVTSLGTIGASGGQGAWCTATPLATITAGMLVFYKRKAADAVGTWYPIAFKYLSAQTINTTTPPVAQKIAEITGMDFEAGDEIGVGTWTSLSASLGIDLGWYDLTKPA